MAATRTTCRGPVTRRSFIEAGALALGGLGLSDLLRLRGAAHASGPSSTDTSVILIWLQGGPSHMETYDLKPAAPVEYRGPYAPIATNVAGIEISELLPQLDWVDQIVLVVVSSAHRGESFGQLFQRNRLARLDTRVRLLES